MDDSSTWGPFCWVVIAESFPLRTRAKQASLATAGNWLGNCKLALCRTLPCPKHETELTPSTVLISFLTPFANAGISYNYGFVFAGCNIAGLLIVYFFMYESQGLTLENVDLMYSDRSVKAWNSRSWTPPGYVTRGDKEERPKAFASDDGNAEKRADSRGSDHAGVEHRV